ncbi:MAG: hypothetical protein JJU34_09740 [Lunatimonas sp.]|uniref:hypothetical protein n=1 Tax=Lunatimonas sp. TaxID=2060141 RepID=UPI00263A3FAC|nr:hypothetical protein [Lunatimonas sp.]MCC5937554.1 hypothetical protein [Lunatimonas sp.]
MTELIVYSLLFLAIIAHLVLASIMYKRINAHPSLSFHEKNRWRLRALIFPAYFWFAFQKKK